MKKYLLMEDYGNNKHAGSKATNDVIKILLQNGYEPISGDFFQKHFSSLQAKMKKMPWIIRRVYDVLCVCVSLPSLKTAFKKVENNSVVFIQYPSYELYMRIFLRSFFFNKLTKKKNLSIQILIHDLKSLRTKKLKKLKEEKKIFFISNSIICHTQMMKNYLIENEIDSKKIKILNVFDYIANIQVLKREKNNEIVFAGNLGKTVFLNNLTQLGNNLKFNLYGIGYEAIPFTENVKYKGAYSPDVLPTKLEGSFGLVWDGDKLDCCSGLMGEYQKFNSPHKVSLYIVSRLPIICWRQAALCEFIEKNNLGFGVNSLYELEKAICNISDEKYDEMISNLNELGDKLEKGLNLIEILNDNEGI